MQIKFSITPGSLKEFIASMDTARATIEVVAGDYLEVHGDQVLEQSDLEVPRDTNTLASTRYREDVEYKGDIVSVKIGYASPQTDRANPDTAKMASQYAIDVHENLGYQHFTGRAKFLELPLMESKDEFLSGLRDAIEQALSTGGR